MRHLNYSHLKSAKLMAPKGRDALSALLGYHILEDHLSGSDFAWQTVTKASLHGVA